MIVGASLAAFGFLMSSDAIWQAVTRFLLRHWPQNHSSLAHREHWFINGTYMWLISYTSAITATRRLAADIENSLTTWSECCIAGSTPRTAK